MRSCLRAALCCALFILAPVARSDDAIPKAAWKRPIGEPLSNPGGKKPGLGQHIDDGYWQGAPVGGFGAGTFCRTYRGDFSRWHIKAGVNKYETVFPDEFAMFQQAEGDAEGTARVLLADHPRNGQLKSWSWDYPVGAGDYYALYPKSWYDYRWEKFPAHVVLEQFSPILPGNYRESSYPVAVYRWHAENPTDRPVTVSILLSWANMGGWFRTYSSGLSRELSQGDFNRLVTEDLGSNGTMKGIVLDRHRAPNALNEWDGQFVIAALESPGVEVSYQTTYHADGDGRDVWTPFAKDGRLANSDKRWVSCLETLAGAIAVRFTLKPGERRIVPLVISWDFPVTEFGLGRRWFRRYTDFYGTSGTNGWAIARDGLLSAAAWSDLIDSWQAPFVNDESKPLWYRGMLFNELYILTDGGSFWARPAGSDHKTTPQFGFVECFDYPFYESVDVRFYGSMPLVKFWPEIDKQVLRQLADTVPREMPDNILWNWKFYRTGTTVIRVQKKKGLVAHDLGLPQGDPFFNPDDFDWQDTNDWKDLNSQFVLMVYRDYILTGRKDLAFLRYTWPAVKEAIEYLRQFDKGGGVPENGGFPDQTYDNWVVSGVSAYSGGLWLAALRASEEMARTLGQPGAAAQYHAMFLKAQNTYVSKLWNGEYFLYDTEGEYQNNIQADQLAGQWYANMTGLGDLVPREMQLAALKKIFDFNVMKFNGGEMGALNGMAPDGSIIRTNEQVQEVWVGTTFGLAALMLSDDMKDEAFQTVHGLYSVIYETKGYWFRTPEAWDTSGHYRASMYMRPAAIWAMEMTRPPAPAGLRSGTAGRAGTASARNHPEQPGQRQLAAP
jgi:non-lysosomal glucosylceramidase